MILGNICLSREIDTLRLFEGVYSKFIRPSQLNVLIRGF